MLCSQRRCHAEALPSSLCVLALVLIFAACVLGRSYLSLQLVYYGLCTYVCSFCICECGSGCTFARGCHLHLLLAPTTHNPSPPWKMFKASSYSFPTYKAYFISLIATASPLEKELTVHTFHCTSLEFSKPFSYVLAAIMILLASGRRCLGYGNFDFLASIVKYFIC